MKITVKKNLIIFHKPREWESISRQLIRDYGPSIMITWKMKRELGFTVRRHKGLIRFDVHDDALVSEFDHRFHYEDQIHLDFFNQATQSWFQLKYITEQ